MTLARGGGVSIESNTAEEIEARVTIAGAALAPTVSVYPADVEWDCDCESPLDVCEHVAAVVIACRQGTGQKTEARPIEYRLRRTPRGLFFERGVSGAHEFHPIVVPLDALAAGRFNGPKVGATPDDLAVEKALGANRRGILEAAVTARVFRALAPIDRVTLDGEPVRVSGEPARPTLIVEDADGGFRLRLEPPDATDVLRPEAEVPLSGREYHDLERGRVYGPDEVGELVGVLLPSFEKRLAVDVRTTRLPSSSRLRPRMGLTLRGRGDGLYVLAGIVYGDPPSARVEDGRLVAIEGDVPIRDVEAEQAVAERFRYEHGLDVGRGVELNVEAAIELVQKLEHFDGAIEGDGRDAFRLHRELVPRIAFPEDDVELAFDGVGVGAVLSAWGRGESMVRLDEGGFAPLPLDWLDRYGAQVADLLAARQGRDQLPRAALSDLARLCEALDEPPPPGYEALRALADDEAPAPVALDERLRDYQRDGVEWLSFLKRAELGALLADDMGLGKTIQALSVLERRSLVAAPTSVLANWVSEAERFRPELDVAVYHGPDRTLDDRVDVTVTSHAILRLDRDKLAAVDWDVVVIDEAQAIKNPQTDLAQSAYALSARFRISLTGTPIENRLVDLWSQLHFLNPGLLGGLADFEDRYVRPIERGETALLERLRERIRPFFLRRLKEEVAPELPPRTETTLRAELIPAERDVYESVRLAARKEVLAKLDEKGNVLAALEALLRLRQAACHPALVPGQTAESSTKTELLLAALETAASGGHKALVFSQWTTMLDLLEPHLKEQGFRFARLDGSTRDRAGAVRKFQEDPAVSVFLVSLKAGGVGLNLTAADHVFLFDPWWNPAVEEQAFDRAHRIGQDKPVFIHRLVATDTVEERMLELQADKRRLADVAPGGPAIRLTRDNLLALLE